MDDKEQIAKLYHDMYAAMVAKDEAELKRVLVTLLLLVIPKQLKTDRS